MFDCKRSLSKEVWRSTFAFGSAIDWWPERNYSEYMPKGNVKEQLETHVRVVGKRFYTVFESAGDLQLVAENNEKRE